MEIDTLLLLVSLRQVELARRLVLAHGLQDLLLLLIFLERVWLLLRQYARRAVHLILLLALYETLVLSPKQRLICLLNNCSKTANITEQLRIDKGVIVILCILLISLLRTGSLGPLIIRCLLLRLPDRRQDYFLWLFDLLLNRVVVGRPEQRLPVSVHLLLF